MARSQSKKEPELPRVNGPALLKLVDDFHKERKIPKEVIFTSIEAALQQAVERSLGEDEPVEVHIDRIHGNITAQRGDQKLEAAAMDRIIASMGRILAQTVKQLITHKIRDAECQSVFDEYQNRLGRLVVGTVTRQDPSAAIIQLDKAEAILPRSEQIIGETYHVGSRVKAVIHDVRKNGSRVKVVLSRASPTFVERLFEEEIPEIKERVVEIRAIAREAGYRTKMAVSSIDSKVEAVGACVGVRGSRIKQVLDELGGTERIDIVRWNDSLHVMIPNALQPATVQDVIVHPRMSRAIVIVADDQLSLAIGKRGQNVRLGSKLVQLDLEVMTADELQQHITRVEEDLRQLPGMTDEMLEIFIEEGVHSYEDITRLTVPSLAEMVNISEEEAEELMAVAHDLAILEDQQKRQPPTASVLLSEPAAPPATAETDETELADTTGEADATAATEADADADADATAADATADADAEADATAQTLETEVAPPQPQEVSSDQPADLDSLASAAAEQPDESGTETEPAALLHETTVGLVQDQPAIAPVAPGATEANLAVEARRDVPAEASEASPAPAPSARTTNPVGPTTPAEPDHGSTTV